MAKVVSASAAQWLILEMSEYFTLRNRGLLHALPASRYVSTTATFSNWYQALPATWDNGKHFVVKATPPLAGEPLRFQDVEPNVFFALQPENQQDPVSGVSALEFLRSRLGSSATASSPFADIIEWVRFAQKQFQYGLAIVSLAEYEGLIRLENSTRFVSANAFLSPENSLELSAWRNHLPDFEEEKYGLVLKLQQSVIEGSTIPRQALVLSPVYPLTKRGLDILRIENPDIELLTPVFEKTFVRPTLEERALTERRHNAEKLASLASSKPSKEALQTYQQLVEAWELRQKRDASASINQNGRTFWDFLLDYDRTGEKALAIVNTERGYLQDLYLVLGRYLKYTRLLSGDISEDIFKQVMGGWNRLAEDSIFDTDAYRIFTKPAKNQDLILNQIVQPIAPLTSQALQIGFLFLKLRRELGDLEQVLTSEKLWHYEQLVAKDKSELSLALYGIGLVFPFKTFVGLYTESLVKPIKATAQKRVSASNRPAATLLNEKSKDLAAQPIQGDLMLGDTIQL